LPKQDPALKDPASNPNGYVFLPDDCSVGCIDQSGRVTSGPGRHPRVYALAILSVGDKATTYPIIFEPRRNFVPSLSINTITPAAVPAIHVASAPATAPPTPPPAPPPAPPAVTPQLPTPPALSPPPLPQLPTANNTPPPPLPPAPPTPPAQQPAQGLQLSINAPQISIAPPAPPITQPAPPINPAPPSGARREAKQRQAATAKSEESGGEKVSEDTARLGGDLATGRDSAAFTQHDIPATRRGQTRPAPSFTIPEQITQPSAWTTRLQWGGGIALMALAFALAYVTIRPTPRPRRRPPVVPAPAWARLRRRP
jgi:hypothetical protein